MPQSQKGPGVLELQRARLLEAAFAVVAEQGFGGLTARKVVERASASRPVGLTSPVDFRLTIRTQMVLAAVAGHEGVNNREVSELVGIADQGQISRLMARLQSQGLIENARGRDRGVSKAWRVTRQGEAVIEAHRPPRQARRTDAHGGKLATKRGRAPERAGKSIGSAAGRPASGAFRLTVRTHLVLTAIARLGERELLPSPSPSNVEVARAAGIADQAQISRMLKRLEGHGLLRNSGGAGAGAGAPNAWVLTPRGEALIRVSRVFSGRAA
jgi:DNA-binding MarR family transcriptional regulator